MEHRPLTVAEWWMLAAYRPAMRLSCTRLTPVCIPTVCTGMKVTTTGIWRQKAQSDDLFIKVR